MPLHPILTTAYKTIAVGAPPVVRVLPDDWAIAAVAVAAFSALVAAATTVIVAFQARDTRRATDTSTRALAAAQAVAVDTARARLDSGAPEIRLDVSMQPQARNDARPMPPNIDHTPAPLEPYSRPNRKPWYLPSNNKHHVCIWFDVQIENVGDRPAHLEYRGIPIGPRIDQERPEQPPRVLAPKQSASCLLQVNFTIEQWSENYKDQEAGKPPRHEAVARVVCSNDSDSCATDTWELTVTGWPVQPDNAGEGQWILVYDWATTMQYEPLPRRKRDYWISRPDGILLPQPAYGNP